MPTGASSSCTLNGVILEVDPSLSLEVGVQPYAYKDDLDVLRAAHRGTHYFQREGDTIISVATAPGYTPVGERRQRRIADSASLIAPLALDALLRYFHGLNRPVLRYKPLRIFANSHADRLLERALPKGVLLPEWLGHPVGYEFDTRTVYPGGRTRSVLLACDVSTYNIVSATADALITAGFDLRGRYVQVADLNSDPRLTTRLRRVGRVSSVEGSHLALEDHMPGCESVAAKDAFLEPRYETLAWCIAQLVPDIAAKVLSRLDALAATVNSGPERLRRITAMLAHLRDVNLELAPGVPFHIGPLLRDSAEKGPGARSVWFPRREIISRPALVFDPGRRRTDEWNERGLDKHGPYDQRYFTPKRPRIAVICQVEFQGQVEQFVRKFLDGVPEVTVGKRRPYEKGFVRRYLLEQPQVAVFTTTGSDAEAYRGACRRALEHATSKGEEWHLAIVQITESSHALRGAADPYLVTKSVFMKRQVPVQEVTIEKMTATPIDLAFILSDISLAAYAKLGGTPWLLPADETIAHELVIGLGNYQAAGHWYGAKERVVGITTVFTGDGRYLLESRTSAVPYEEYVSSLLSTLRAAIQTVRSDQNWRESDAIRLIFHAFKPLRDAEVEAVERVVAELGLPNAEFAFVHVAGEHPFLVFDEDNKGSPYRGETKGIFAPERGTMLTLNRDEVLVSLTGPREVKQASDGLPRPILLRLHRKSSFRDMTYLARQVFAFSCQSWRGFGLASMPITIQYSQLMAGLLRKLADLPDWDPDAMLGKIGRTRWFL